MKNLRLKLSLVCAFVLLLSTGGGLRGSTLVYENWDVGGLMMHYTPGTDYLAGDDITLAGTERKLVEYDFAVYGDFGSAPYNVTSELYTDSAGYPGTPIPGTYCAFTVNSDGYNWLLCAPGSGAILPDNLWMVLSFDTDYAGWVVGEAAELGFTDDVFAVDEPPWTLYWFGGPPDPWAGFEADIWCVAACDRGDYINPGSNYWTCPDANFVFGGGGGCLPPAPADFFGPGSDPFEGQVACMGDDPVSDVTTERTSQGHVPPPYPSSDLIDIELVELSLKSVAPITVTYYGGMDPELWDVDVDLSAIPPHSGALRATKTHCNGGTYESNLTVQPRFIFTKVDDPGQVRVLDTGLEGLAAVDLNSVGPCEWEHTADGNDFRPSAECPLTVADVEGCSMTLIPAPKMTDSFWVRVGPDGVAEGGGSGYNDGQWYYYPNTDWWNEWFYDHPYNPNRMKVIDVNFTIQPLDPGLASLATVAYNWSTPDWLDPCSPPLPYLDPADEDLLIRRSIFFESDLQVWPQVVQDHFEIPGYNPQWISIDVNGYNFEIIDSWIDHACLPKDGEPWEPKPPVPHLKWSQPPIEIDPDIYQTPVYCGWDEPSHREIISFACWGPTWPYQCHGDADNMASGPFRVAASDLSILRTALGGSYGNPVIPYNACSDFDRNLVVDHKDLDILKEWYARIGVPADCPPWVGSVPSTGGLEYWDLFAVCLSRQDVYWNLVDGGAGSLSDPLVSPDPMATAVIDLNTPLDGVVWGFGGVAWGDNILDSDANNYSIELKEETDYYLSVVLDTSTTPQHNGYFPSWGSISQIVVRPWDPDANDWGDPVVPDWVISPFDPDGGTAVTPGVSSSVTLAGNDFGDLEYDDQGGMGIWGAAAHLPAAAGYKVEFAAEVYTWDSYDNVGPKARIASQNVADDFRCLGTMPITSVHWWGSHLEWSEPCLPAQQPDGWRIAFWSNVAEGVNAGYSYPERPLWKIDVPANRVEVEYVGDDFFPDPCTPSDTCFQYHVRLLRDERFWQHEFLEQTMDETFWISITALYPFGSPPIDHLWGWKTRPWSWMDDAVTFSLYQEPNESTVVAPEHVTPLEYEGQSYDVAFELDTDPNFIKWEQAYDSIRHWPHYEDELSVAHEQVEDINVIRLVADDWPCDHNGPVSAIVWWGSYLGSTYEACQGYAPSIAEPPAYFLLSMWTDVPAGVDTNSHPGEEIWQYRAYEYDEVLVGYDKHPEGSPSEPVFRYSVRLPDANQFCQDANDGIYWLSIVAVYDLPEEPSHPWGWTNHQYVHQDNAVAGYLDVSGPEPVWGWEELHDQTGAGADMSFVLFTECMSCSADEYTAWLNLDKPRCWCYRRQCRGDIDGIQTGPFHVAIPDLAMFKTAFNKFVLPPGGICADLDHLQTGPFRVAIPDLTVFKTYFNQFVVPQCDQPPIVTGPYNFWTSP
ncbi:MAG: DUF7901 domain-containing protein [Planctomycetota bacterium]